MKKQMFLQSNGFEFSNFELFRLNHRVHEVFVTPYEFFAKKASQQLSEQSQKADQQAIDAMSLYGLKVHNATEKLEQEWNTIVIERFGELIGTVIDKKAYDLVIAKIAEYRTKNNH